MKPQRLFVLTGLAISSLGLIFCVCQASSVLSEGRAARLAALSVEPTPKAPTIPVVGSDLQGAWRVTGYVPNGGYQGAGHDQPCPATLHEIPNFFNNAGTSTVGCGETDVVRFDPSTSFFTETDAIGKMDSLDFPESVRSVPLSLSKSQTNSPLSVVSGKYSLENSILTVVMTDVNYSRELKFKVNFIKKSVIEYKEIEKKRNPYLGELRIYPATGVLETETKIILKSPGILSLRQISQIVNGRRVTEEDGSELILTQTDADVEKFDDVKEESEYNIDELEDRFKDITRDSNGDFEFVETKSNFSLNNREVIDSQNWVRLDDVKGSGK